MTKEDSIKISGSLSEDLLEFLKNTNFKKLNNELKETYEYRKNNPEWDRPIVMFGVARKTNTRKRHEIGVIIDFMPWLNRARMAETHWYNIIHKRPATNIEYEWRNGRSRRYLVWRYFIEKKLTIDRALSFIVGDEIKKFGIIDNSQLISAFEKHYNRSIRIYKIIENKQLKLF